MNMLKSNFLCTTLTVSLAMSTSCFAEKELSNLEPFEWENRIILIRTVANTSANTVDQDKNLCAQAIKSLKESEYDIDDRHIIWFVLCNPEEGKPETEQLDTDRFDEVTTNYTGIIASTFSNFIEQQYFKNITDSVVLIGKDSGVKYRASELDLKSINLLIDSMPMRQWEMAEKNK